MNDMNTTYLGDEESIDQGILKRERHAKHLKERKQGWTKSPKNIQKLSEEDMELLQRRAATNGTEELSQKIKNRTQQISINDLEHRIRTVRAQSDLFMALTWDLIEKIKILDAPEFKDNGIDSLMQIKNDQQKDKPINFYVDFTFNFATFKRIHKNLWNRTKYTGQIPLIGIYVWWLGAKELIQIDQALDNNNEYSLQEIDISDIDIRISYRAETLLESERAILGQLRSIIYQTIETLRK